jgi:hypothetical protein
MLKEGFFIFPHAKAGGYCLRHKITQALFYRIYPSFTLTLFIIELTGTASTPSLFLYGFQSGNGRGIRTTWSEK